MQHTTPIDARQHVWWHRLRRLRSWGFVVLLGGLAAPLVTVLLFGGVVVYYDRGWPTFVQGGMLIWLVTAPLYLGACAWTWFHMEKRYGATLAVRCPECGYSLRGGVGAGRCTECGEPVRGAARLQPRPLLAND